MNHRVCHPYSFQHQPLSCANSRLAMAAVQGEKVWLCILGVHPLSLLQNQTKQKYM